MRWWLAFYEIHRDVRPNSSWNGQGLKETRRMNRFMLVDLACFTLPHIFFNIILHASPIKVTFSTMNRLMIARVAGGRISMDILHELELEGGAFNNPQATL
jgi:hypothetical protein